MTKRINLNKEKKTKIKLPRRFYFLNASNFANI